MRLLSLSLSLLPLVSSSAIPARHRLSAGELDDAVLGVGIHFTTSYATAAVRYESGKVKDLIRVKADAEYIDAMRRWADEATKTSCDTRLEKLQCSATHISRQWNKWVGRPATRDVGILAAFLQEIKTEVEAILEVKATRKGQLGAVEVTNIFPVFPILPALEESDIQDALEYVGLDWLSSNKQPSSHLYHETNAALGGLGHGLCTSWKHTTECAREEAALESQHILFLNFDNTSFSAALQYLSTPYDQQSLSVSALSMSHGWDSLPIYEIARAKFWARIQEMILDVAGSLQEPPRKIVLMGAFASDAEFMEVVESALWEGMEWDVSGLVEGGDWEENWLASARGAAELAGRVEWRRRFGEMNHEEAVEM